MANRLLPDGHMGTRGCGDAYRETHRTATIRVVYHHVCVLSDCKVSAESLKQREDGQEVYLSSTSHVLPLPGTTLIQKLPLAWPESVVN